MSEKLKAAVQEFYDRGWNRGDLSVIDELFSPGTRIMLLPHIRALADSTEPAGSSKPSAPRSRICMSRSRPIRGGLNGDHEVDGTHEGTLMGVPATRRHIEVSGISIDRFDEQGLFAEGWGNWDGVALLRQIGALPTASQ